MRNTLQAAPVYIRRHVWGVAGWPGGKLTCVKEIFETQEAAQAHADLLNKGKKLPNWGVRPNV